MPMMEKRRWGLLRDPFCGHAAAVKPFLVNEPFQRAYRNLLAAARSAHSCLLLTGEPGLGKTMLLRYLVRGLPLAGIVVETFPPHRPSSELEANGLLPDAAATLKEGQAVQAVWPAFRTHVAQRAREGRPIVLAVDDADTLSDALLLEILALRSTADRLGVPLTILIVGTPAIAPRLGDIARVSGCEIAVQAELSALSEPDIAAYVTQALARAGCRGARLFPPDTISRLSARSNGILSNINMICRRALALAEGADLDTVTPEIIDRAADDQRLEQSRGETHVAPPAGSAEPPQEKNGSPEPLGAATIVEHALAEAPGEHTGLSDAPIVGLPLIAPNRGLVVTPEIIDRAVDDQRLEQSRGETHVAPPAASAEPLQEKNGPPEPLGAATTVEHALAEAPGEHTGLSDAPIVGRPLIAPGRGLTPDAMVQGKPKAVPSSPSLRTTIAGAAMVVLALVGTAVAWTLLRSGMDAPVEAGTAADASDPLPPTMAIPRAPEPYAEPALAPATAATSPSAAATTKAETAGPIVIPLPTEPTAPDRLAEEAMGDEQPAPATPSPLASHAEIALLLARGDELLAILDVVSARLFFARAAARRNAPAMTVMASTYDPLMLASRNVRGVHPEPREAISWYRRAAAAGDATAVGRLRALVDVLRQSGQIDASESAALLRVGEEGHNSE